MSQINQIQTQQFAPNMGKQVRDQIRREGTAGFAKMMESVFLQQMLQQMNQSMVFGGLFGSSHQAQMYQGMYMEALAEKMADAGGIGLADMIQAQLQKLRIESTNPQNNINPAANIAANGNNE